MHHAGDAFRLISIHALREEGDKKAQKRTWWQLDFNPRPPRGGRPSGRNCGRKRKRFQSTPSARRATLVNVFFHRRAEISIHALREEGDVQRFMQLRGVVGISIHALREEGDSPGR